MTEIKTGIDVDQCRALRRLHFVQRYNGERTFIVRKAGGHSEERRLSSSYRYRRWVDSGLILESRSSQCKHYRPSCGGQLTCYSSLVQMAPGLRTAWLLVSSCLLVRRRQKNGLADLIFAWPDPDLVGAFRRALPVGPELTLHYRQCDCSLLTGRARVYETLTLRIG